MQQGERAKMPSFTGPFPPIDSPGGPATQAPAGGSGGTDIFARVINLATSVYSLYQKDRAFSKQSDAERDAMKRQSKAFKRSLRLAPASSPEPIFAGAIQSESFGPILLVGGVVLLGAVWIFGGRGRRAHVA